MESSVFSHLNTEAPSSEDGPLAGKSFAIQPNMSVRGWPTDAGSKALEGFVPLETATVIERIEAAGGRIVGSTLMPELGFGLGPNTAADAVRDGRCDVALVTDLMGESRIIASDAGAFGFKPSYGSVSRFGLIGLVPSMEAFGFVSTSLSDMVRTLAAVGGRDDCDTTMVEGNFPDFRAVGAVGDGVKRIGMIRECAESLNADEADGFRKALKRLEEFGVQIEEVSLPDYPLFRLVHHVVGATEASSSAGKYDGVRYGHRTAEAENWNEMYIRSRAECFGTLVKSYLLQGAYFQFKAFPAFEDACRIRRRLADGVNALFDQVDLIAMPMPKSGSSETGAPGTVTEVYETFKHTLGPNVTGQPCLSLPAKLLGTAGVGIQLSVRFLDDVRLLSLASRLTAN